MILRLGTRTLTLDQPRVMGIVNVTPDSFSDGGQFLNPDDALRHATRLYEEGADIIDVGGESTRPGARAVALDEEIDRVTLVIENIVSDLDVPVSVDTGKPQVMEAACAAGATLINDVWALRRDGALQAAADLNVPICLMHMQGEPASMQEAPQYENLPGDVIRFLGKRVDACLCAGIEHERLIVDPGFGFGKNDDHNTRILANLTEFRELGLPLLVGLSRKRWLGNLTGRAADDRISAGVAAAVIAVTNGASIVRTHDVAATVDALRIAQSVLGARQTT